MTAIASGALTEEKPREGNRVLRRFLKKKTALVAGTFLLLFVIIALAAPLVAPYDPLKTNFLAIRQPPSWAHLLGTDEVGRDLLSRLIWGARASLFAGIIPVCIALAVSIPFGLLSGFAGGWVDDLLEWFYSVFTAIPGILLILAFAAVLRPGLVNIIVILGLTGWTGIYRLVRAEYIKHSTREYVQAADAIGASNARRMFVHIFPNVSHISLVQLSVHTVGFIKSEVILSFLGFGVPVDKVSWGSMLGEAQNELILGYWWQLAAATIAMAILVTAFSMFTDALRDALDPKIK